ncbi:unnamed protein product [Linum trigynum]|uniref:Uncharacterized protein n=1 Tax=Linum trigynum TaxID=586398 RepID=A0AAV2FAZ9_9ROSI
MRLEIKAKIRNGHSLYTSGRRQCGDLRRCRSPPSPTTPSSTGDDFLFAGIVVGVRHLCYLPLPLEKKKMKTRSDLVEGTKLLLRIRASKWMEEEDNLRIRASEEEGGYDWRNRPSKE